MVRKKKIQVPTRAEGDPTGQTQMLQEQVDAVSPGQEIERPAPAPVPTSQPMQDIFGTPTQKLEQPGNELGENEAMFTANNDIEIVKAILLEKFPSLTSRF
tara:strand:- start:486 stop:788 length:303 start_codon:yes stop_codon:yes gene_type:complete